MEKWEKQEDVCRFLETFNAYYSDYTTTTEGDYCDICFATAETLLLLTADSPTKMLNRGEVLKHLREKVVIHGELNTGSGGHAWAMFPYKNVVIVVQSLGALYASFFTVWDPVRLKLELEGLEKGNTESLFYFVDSEATKFEISYKVAKRKDLNVNLLPERNLEWLEQERDIYLKERSDEKGNLKYDIPENYRLLRTPDALHQISKMKNPIDLQKRIDRCTTGMKGLTSS